MYMHIEFEHCLTCPCALHPKLGTVRQLGRYAVILGSFLQIERPSKLDIDLKLVLDRQKENTRQQNVFWAYLYLRPILLPEPKPSRQRCLRP